MQKDIAKSLYMVVRITFFMKTNFDEAEIKIIEELEKEDKPISKNILAKRLGLSTSAVSKYVDILEAQGKIQVERYESMHLVSRRGCEPIGE